MRELEGVVGVRYTMKLSYNITAMAMTAACLSCWLNVWNGVVFALLGCNLTRNNMLPKYTTTITMTTVHLCYALCWSRTNSMCVCIGVNNLNSKALLVFNSI